MTLEDDTGVTNTIVWPRVFETFRPVVFGVRLISLTGKLQSEAVVAVIAESHDEGSSADLTAMRRLSLAARSHAERKEFSLTFRTRCRRTKILADRISERALLLPGIGITAFLRHRPIAPTAAPKILSRPFLQQKNVTKLHQRANQCRVCRQAAVAVEKMLTERAAF